MKILLHIGTHKTGTTSIQRFARGNEDNLKSRGWLYPGYDIVNARGHYAHHHIAHGLAMVRNNRIDLETARKFIKEAVRLAESYEYLFLSAEPFYRHFSGHKSVVNKSDSYWEAREKYISSVKDCFPENGNDIQVIITIRRQADFAMSLYKESVRTKRYSKKFSVFLDEHWYYFEYIKQIKLWEKFFGKVKVLVFEDLVATGNLVENFFSSLDLNIKDLPTTQIANKSWCADFFEFKRRMNATSCPAERLEDIKFFLEKNNTLWMSEHEQTSKDLVVSTETLNQFQAKFNTENETIATGCLLKKCDKLFSGRIYLKNEEYKGLDSKRECEIFSRYLDYLFSQGKLI